MKSLPFKRIAFIGDYLPRRCGIATFTTDLCESIAGELPDTCCFAVPVNDREEGYAYPPRVRFEIEESDPASYRRAADFLNINRVDLVCLQHEYGIYGGSAGSHILGLLSDLRMPVVTTLHTVLKEPDATQRRVMSRLAAFSDRLVVMSHLGVKFLREIYNIPESKIDFIPHGIPDVPFVDSSFYKDHFGVEGKQVLLTFGLLSPNKGIEYAIEALPAILAKHPNVVYIVLGATHPHVQRADGESYRLQLQRLARTKGVERNILFFDQFVGIEELVEFIGAADIYLTPYLNPAQITSGTLAYTVGAGKAVVSTPYWYAEELLGEGRGLLIPFADSKAIAERVIELLDNDTERHAMRKRAYMLGREMTWPRVAQRYLESFVQAAEERKQRPRAAFKVPTLDTRPPYLLPLNLNHLRQMTDDTGLVQHAYFTVPNYHEGYATDDNARGLIVAVYLEERGENPQNEISVLASRYLAFLINSFSSTTNRFRNFLSYDRRWQEKIGSEDCHGRSLWGLGTVIGRSKQPGLRGAATHLFEAALPTTENFASPRAWAFTLLAIYEYRKRFGGDRVARRLMETLSKRLLEIYRRNYTADWPWFEFSLTYCNAVLPHALLVCGQTLGEEEMIETGLRSLEWLAHLQQATQGHFVPIGSNGFYPRGGERARFDQQPVEAQAMVSACLAAKAVTDNTRWDQHLHRAFDWFLGHNDLGLSLYDPGTGGCRDGLHSDRCNQNEGAESTLAFLHSLLEICLAETPSPADPAEESSPVSPKSEAVAAKRD
jgi:glycosyltransferase involved in cell wall biosynthesis